MREDEAAEAPVPAELEEEDERGDADRDLRDDQRRGDESLERAAPREPVARDRERGERAGDERAGGRDERDLEAADRRRAEAAAVEEVRVPLRREARRRPLPERRRVERLDDDDRDRRDHEGEPRDEERVQQRAPPADPHREYSQLARRVPVCRRSSSVKPAIAASASASSTYDATRHAASRGRRRRCRSSPRAPGRGRRRAATASRRR